MWDNSFKNNGQYPIDYCVISGSPEWSGHRLKPLFEFVKKHKIPTYFLGVGGSQNLTKKTLSKLDWQVLTQAKLITTRDSSAQHVLNDLNAVQLPCPALFSATSTKKISTLKKVGLVFATNNSTENNRITKDVDSYLTRLYRYLINHYDCELICHYIDELESVAKHFPGTNYHYHYDAAQYEHIFGQFDCIISPRIHGCGMASSLGIPNIHIAHSDRSETTLGFKSTQHDVESGIDAIMDQVDEIKQKIESINESLIQHKHDTLNSYLNAIKAIA